MKNSLGMRIPHSGCVIGHGSPWRTGVDVGSRSATVAAEARPERSRAAHREVRTSPERRLYACAGGPSHAVDLARLVTDDVPHPPPVHPAGGRAAATRAAAAREAGVPVQSAVVGGASESSGASSSRVISPGRGAARGGRPAATRSATAVFGSRPVTRDSPTRTASAPALAYAIRSCGPRTPDSAILTMLVRDLGGDPLEGGAVDLEGLQVARVDADDLRARRPPPARPRPRRAPRRAG